MKRRGLIAFTIIIMLLMSTMLISADEGALKLVSTYPKDGQKNTSVENVGVKLMFNNSVSSEDTRNHNKGCISIVNKKTGKKLKIKLLSSKRHKGLVLALGDNADGKLKVVNNAEYELRIDKSFADDNGNTLGRDIRLNFTTFNQKLNNSINVALMIVMFGGIALMTIREQKKKRDEENAESSKETKKKETFNPYKEAKRTGRSVEDVLAEHNRKEAKKMKKLRRKGESSDEEESTDLNLAELLPYVYRVRAPRPISDAGGRYKSGLGVVKNTGDNSRSGRAKRRQ